MLYERPTSKLGIHRCSSRHHNTSLKIRKQVNVLPPRFARRFLQCNAGDSRPRRLLLGRRLRTWRVITSQRAWTRPTVYKPQQLARPGRRGKAREDRSAWTRSRHSIGIQYCPADLCAAHYRRVDAGDRASARAQCRDTRCRNGAAMVGVRIVRTLPRPHAACRARSFTAFTLRPLIPLLFVCHETQPAAHIV